MPRNVIKRKEIPPLDSERLKLCPGGRSNCPICTIGVIDDLKYIHYLRFEKKFTYKQIREYLKATFGISPNFSALSDHFIRHLAAEMQMQKLTKRRGRPRKECEKTAITKAIDNIPKETRMTSNQDMETAYKHLTKLAYKFTKKVQQVYDLVSEDEEKLKTRIKDIDPLIGMERVARLSREARELLKDLQALRAPKIIVAHFLEQAIDQVILETGFVLSDGLKNIQEDLFEAIRTQKVINTEIFGRIFQQTGEEFRRKMIDLRRDQIAKATATLADLEKLI